MFYWVVIGGIMQALVLAIFLFGTNRGDRKANVILSSYLLTLALYLLLTTLLGRYDWAAQYFMGLGFSILFLIGPLLFFYIRRLFKEKSSVKTKALHWLPTALVIIYLFPLYISPSAEKLDRLNWIRAHGLPVDLSVLWIVACLHIISYTGFIFLKTFQYNRDLKDTYSRTEQINLDWMVRFSLMNFTLWSLYFIAYVLGVSGVEIDPLGIIDQAFNAILSLFLFYIGYVAMSHPEIFPNSTIVPVFRRSGAAMDDPEKRDEDIQKLKAVMEREQPYTIPELTLHELANISGISPRKLTAIINEEFGLNFYNYINQYRIADFKERIADKNNDQFTILSIAQDCGFNSKSTFNHVFKKFEKTTPSEYKKSVQA